MKAKMFLAVAVLAVLSCQKKQSTPVQEEHNSLASAAKSSRSATKNDYDSTGIYHNIMLDSALVYALNNRTRNSAQVRNIMVKVYAKYYPVDSVLIQKTAPVFLKSISNSGSNPLENLNQKAPEYPFLAELFQLITQAGRLGYDRFKEDIGLLKQKAAASEVLSANVKERVLGTLSVAENSAYRWLNLQTINMHLEFFIPFSPAQFTEGAVEAISVDTRAYLKAKANGHSEHTARVLSAIASVEEFFENLWPF